MAAVRKYSVTLDGHRTSLSLEPEFWNAFRTLCRARQRPPIQVLGEIDRSRDGNLSSAVRLWVLKALTERA